MKQRIVKLMKEGKKDRAKMVLRVKKAVEKQIEKLEGEMLNLETMVNSLEFSTVEKDVMAALEKGNTTLKKINEEIR